MPRWIYPLIGVQPMTWLCIWQFGPFAPINLAFLAATAWAVLSVALMIGDTD